MKHYFYKNILRAKFMATRASINGDTRYFWKFSSAIEDVQSDSRREVVWTIDGRKIYIADGQFSITKIIL